MTSTTENRIWRGLFLAAIVGCGIAATSGEKADKVVGGWSRSAAGPIYLIMSDGRVARVEEEDYGSDTDPEAGYLYLDLKPFEK